MARKLEVREELTGGTPPAPTKTRKEWLQDLYKTLRELRVNSIGDLENLIARAE